MAGICDAADEHGFARRGGFQAEWQAAHWSNSYGSCIDSDSSSEEIGRGWEVCGVLW